MKIGYITAYFYVRGLIKNKYAESIEWSSNMKCELYRRTRIENGDIAYVPFGDKTFFNEMSLDIVQAMQLLLDKCFQIGEVTSLDSLVKKIEEKKSAGIFAMPPHCYEDNEEGLSSYAFFRACNCLEFLYGFSQGLRGFPLDLYGIKFD